LYRICDTNDRQVQGLLSPSCRGEAFPPPSFSSPFHSPLPLEAGLLNPGMRSGERTHLYAILSPEDASGGNKTVLSVHLLGQSFTSGQEMPSKVVVSGGISFPLWLIYEAICLIAPLSRRPWTSLPSKAKITQSDT